MLDCFGFPLASTLPILSGAKTRSGALSSHLEILKSQKGNKKEPLFWPFAFDAFTTLHYAKIGMGTKESAIVEATEATQFPINVDIVKGHWDYPLGINFKFQNSILLSRWFDR